jgi:RNA polymerase sigma-70 factor, ECF subfamily
MCAERVSDAQQRRAGDLALAQRAASGDEQARRSIAQRLFERVRTTVRYLAASHPDGDDFVQLSLLEVLRSLGTFRAETKLESWADRIVVRTALRLIKRQRRHGEVIALFSGGEVPPKHAEGAPHHQLRRHVQSLLQRLTPERQAVVVLQLVHGYSVAEIAELTDTPINTVRDRLRIGKTQLRKFILKDPALRAYGKARDT